MSFGTNMNDTYQNVWKQCCEECVENKPFFIIDENIQGYIKIKTLKIKFIK